MHDDMDEEIRRIESRIGDASVAEILWGGPHRPGLTYTVAQIADTVNKLSAAVDKIATEVNGVDGIRSDLRDLRRRCDGYDTSWRLVYRIIGVLALIGVATLIIDTKLIYQVVTESVK